MILSHKQNLAVGNNSQQYNVFKTNTDDIVIRKGLYNDYEGCENCKKKERELQQYLDRVRSTTSS